MLNAVSAATGLQLEYVREEFFGFVLLNTVQYTLKDADGQLYYFIMSFDVTQDFWIDRENTQSDPLGPIWSGQVFGRRCCLYRRLPYADKALPTDAFGAKVTEEVVLSTQIIARIQEDFLDSYPSVYRDQIRDMKEFQACFSLLSVKSILKISEEYGIFQKEQLGSVDGKLVVALCNFHRRQYQPAGYDAYIYHHVCGGKKCSDENLRFHRAKYLLEKKIETFIARQRKPIVTDRVWTDTQEHTESFALNNFPLLYPQRQNYILQIKADYQTSDLALSIDRDKAVLGTWMSGIGREFFLAAVRYIFKKYKNVKIVEYQNLLYDTLLDHGWKHNDFYLPLPQTTEELKLRLSAKGRYNIKREKRIIADDFSGLQLEDLPFQDVLPEHIKTFYDFKNATHGVSEDEYDITKRHLTDVYLLTVGSGEIKGIAVSCEQGDIVFLENHTFDSSMRQYSFGQVLYDMYLDKMIEKGKKGVALAGGNLEYKKRYGTYCAIARSGAIYRVAYSFSRFSDLWGLDYRSSLFRRISNKINKCKLPRRRK